MIVKPCEARIRRKKERIVNHNQRQFVACLPSGVRFRLIIKRKG